ncbi:MAG TPA: beta-ketoacyl-ACP reductase, partial [Pusillimonas sp.]|nr:beta-ketoacyl-ACP reductase [Pusillimonas sp.]
MTKRTALVTGGMGCLGEAIAKALHDAGNAVWVTYFPGHEEPEPWLARLREEGYELQAVGVDVSDYDSCRQCVDQLVNKEVEIDILINNA